MKKTLALLIAFGGMMTAQAQAATIFESDPNHTTGFADNRSAGSTAVGRLSVSTTTNIGGIGVFDYLTAAGSLKFFIANATTGAILYLSDAKAFAADTGTAGSVSSLTYKDSNAFNFTLQAGTTYAIGSIANVATYTYADFSQTNSSNGLSSLLGNINVDNFANPTIDTGQACCSIGFRLLSPAAAAVPEASTWAMLTLGIGAMGWSLRRRRSVRVAYA